MVSEWQCLISPEFNQSLHIWQSKNPAMGALTAWEAYILIKRRHYDHL